MQPGTRIGIDIGGTFTDFVVFNPGSGSIETFKLLSTPHNPAEAVLKGLRLVARGAPPDSDNGPDRIIHGSTVATNALLERKGARTALVATQGFGDVLQIGRQNRPSLYDFSDDPPPPLVPEELRFEVRERVDHHGNVLIPLNPAEIDELVQQLGSLQVESVAVCLLFSFLYPEHESLVASRLRDSGLRVSPSFEILPEYREYERISTTVVNAYVSPVLDNYLGYLESALGETGDRLRVMQSNGGHISIREARLNGVRCILSGPAGGVVGARYTAQLALSMPQPATRPPHPQTQPQRPLSIITFDMGGTSTDVSLVYGDARVTTESVVGGYPIRIPVLDIHTIGAGGGSIASVDLGGALRVGPESAGADPGPACYGRGDGPGLPTVTDANLVLGRLAAEHFLGGEMPLDGSRAAEALTTLGKAMGLDRTRAALGVIEVVNAHMERALRVISVERGYDPRDFTLLSFGGAGGLHAADLARRLDIPQVLIPPLASTLSAFGMLAADVVKDYTQTVMLPGDAPSQAIAAALAPLAARGQAEVLAEGIPDHDVKIERFLDMRYTGQSYELTVPWVEEGPGPLATFQQYHRQAYGYARPQDTSVEIVNVRVRATGRGHPPPITASRPAGADPVEALLEYRPVVLTPTSGPAPVPFYRYEWLRPGNEIAGPAVIVRSDTTLLVGPADEAVVDTYHNLIISVGR